MASLKEVKNRITSVRSTRQITSAMKMVASAKLHKAQSNIESMLPYQRKLNEIVGSFLQAETTFDSPYTDMSREIHRVAVVVFSSNASLCGAFNSNVIKRLDNLLSDYASLGKENILVYPVGKKVEEFVRKTGYEPQGSFQSMADKPSYVAAYSLAKTLMQLFTSGQVDRVELIYHHFKSAGSQILKREEFLPLDYNKIVSESSDNAVSTASGYYKDYIIEPSAEELIAQLIPKVLSQKIYTVLLDSHASEHAARMLAMQTATDNANELIQDLTIQYNKGRQQAITNELLDIVAGSMK